MGAIERRIDGLVGFGIVRDVRHWIDRLVGNRITRWIRDLSRHRHLRYRIVGRDGLHIVLLGKDAGRGGTSRHSVALRLCAWRCCIALRASFQRPETGMESAYAGSKAVNRRLRRAVSASGSAQ